MKQKIPRMRIKKYCIEKDKGGEYHCPIIVGNCYYIKCLKKECKHFKEFVEEIDLRFAQKYSHNQ